MSEKMTIAYLTSVYGRASDTFIRVEVQELRAREHTVFTYSIRRPEPEHTVSPEVESEQRGTDYILERGLWRLLGATVRAAVASPARFISAARLAWNTRTPGLKALVWQAAYLVEAAYLAGELRRRGVQHLHNHIAQNSASVAMLTSELSGIPYSMTVHGPSIFYEPLRWALPEKIVRSAFTACISDFCRSQCMAFTPADAWGKLHIVRCGLDRTFLDAPAVTVPAVPRLVSVGRLCEAKGQLLLIEAMARLKAEGVRAELVLIGDGPMRAPIEALIDRHRLHEEVKLLGWRDSARVRQELLDARVMVLPSFAEGLPVVLMEALALGRPVITTYIAGIPELVEHGVNGWLVPAGSLDRLVHAIREALATPVEELERMGSAGKRSVELKHSVAREAAKLEDLMRRTGHELPVFSNDAHATMSPT